jgi:hypothetical protein
MIRRWPAVSATCRVHEVATSHQQADLAYFSSYAGGFRVTGIVNNELVGLYIFRYTGT